jgi:hypothetical protein
MSVVAGCSLFNGVLLAADSRITFASPDGRRQYADVAQKLFVIAPGTAIGFVSADVRLASLMIRGLLEQTHRRKRRDHISLARWMPRLFRATSRLWERQQRQAAPYTAFLGASVLPWQPNVIRRADVVALMNRIAFGNPGIQRNWIPPILIHILSTPPTTEYVALPGTAYGLLFTMEPPDFSPRYLQPLRFTAIGTGRDVVRDIDRVHDWIFAGDVGNRFVEAMSFVDVVQGFARDNGIDTVGGLYPLLRVDASVGGDMVQAFGSSHEVPAGGARIQLTYENEAWVQRNLTTGRELRLVPPWEVDQFRNAGVFDDLDRAYRQMYHRAP